MTKRQKAQRIIGIVLLVVLLAPVAILLRPATYVDYFPVYTEHTYIPLINIFQNSRFGPMDIAFMVGYVALFGLAIWLVVRSTRYKRTQ